VVAAQSVSAQAPARYIYVATVTAKFGQLQEFLEYERQIQEARGRTSDRRSVSVHQMQVGGAPNRFHVVIPVGDLSEMDSWQSVPDLLISAFGQRDGSRIYAEGTSTLESVEYAVHVLQPDHSSGSGVSVSGATLTSLVTTRVRPEMADDYAAYLVALKVAEDKRGIRRTRRNVTFGDLFTYTSVSQATGWSTLRSDPGPAAVIIDEFGEEVGGTLLAKANAAVVSRTIEVLRLREDLSYAPN
jgi:hypothetical protein